MNSITDGAHIEAGPDLESPYPAAASPPGSCQRGKWSHWDGPHPPVQLVTIAAPAEAWLDLDSRALGMPVASASGGHSRTTRVDPTKL